MQMLAALVCGLIFGWGLLISGMVEPAKVIGFLDIFGAWDPSLAIVMAAALAAAGVGFRLVAARQRPVLAAQCSWPTRTDVDAPLVIGAILFGAGWGSWVCAQVQRWRILRLSHSASLRSSSRWHAEWVCIDSGRDRAPKGRCIRTPRASWMADRLRKL